MVAQTPLTWNPASKAIRVRNKRVGLLFHGCRDEQPRYSEAGPAWSGKLAFLRAVLGWGGLGRSGRSLPGHGAGRVRRCAGAGRRKGMFGRWTTIARSRRRAGFWTHSGEAAAVRLRGRAPRLPNPAWAAPFVRFMTRRWAKACLRNCLTFSASWSDASRQQPPVKRKSTQPCGAPVLEAA